MLKKPYLILLAGVCIPTFMFFNVEIHAQNLPLETINRDLDSITVYGSRLASSALTEGKNIHILSKELIQSYSASSLDELLAQVTGVHITTRNGFGAQADIGIRGSTYAQILVVLDGQRINDPLTGHFNAYLSLPIEQIHQIEIIKGPSSASYGSDAVGGVIVVTTKNYRRYTLLKEPSSLQISELTGTKSRNSSYQLGSKIGSFGSQRHYTGLDWNTARASTDAYASITRIDGPSYSNPNHPSITTAPSNYRSFYNQDQVGISQAYRWSSGLKQYLRLGYDRRDFNAKYFYTTSSFDESIEEIERYWGQLSTRKEMNTFALVMDGMIQQTTDVFTFNPNFAPNEHTTTQTQFHAALNSLSKSDIDFSIGIQSLLKNIQSTDRGNHNRRGIASYAMVRDTWEIHRKYSHYITLNFGLRADYDPSYDLQFIPQFSAKWRHHWGVIQSSVGKAIRAADFTELFVSHNLDLISSGRNVGNSNLMAEESFAYDVSYQTPSLSLSYVPFDVRYSVAYFARDSKGLIDYVYTSENDIQGTFNLEDDGYYFYPQNVNSAFSYGVEQQLSMVLSSEASPSKGAMFRAKPQIHSSKRNTNLSASLHLGHSFIRTSVDGTVVSKYLLQHPRQQFNSQLRIHAKDVGFHLQMRHLMINEELGNSDFFVIASPQTLIDTKVSYRNAPNIFGTGNDLSLEWTLEVRNLLNKEYQQILGAVLPKRWLTLGLRITNAKPIN